MIGQMSNFYFYNKILPTKIRTRGILARQISSGQPDQLASHDHSLFLARHFVVRKVRLSSFYNLSVTVMKESAVQKCLL